MRVASAHLRRTFSRVLAHIGFGDGPRKDFANPQHQAWARSVRSREEVPAVYQPFLDTLPAHHVDPFPFTVLISPCRGNHSVSEPERLVLAAGQQLSILERAEDGFRHTSYRFDDIYYVEAGVILLHSWITIYGIVDSGCATSSTIAFNSVTDHVMAPLVASLRASHARIDGVVPPSASTGFGCLAKVNIKFMNYGKRSILRDEGVIQFIFQPEIRQHLQAWLQHSFSRSVSPAHLCILTDRELILLRDDDSQKWLRGSPHGAIWSYVPLDELTSASIRLTEQKMLSLRIDLPGNLYIESLFESSKQTELERLLRQLNSIAIKSRPPMKPSAMPIKRP